MRLKARGIEAETAIYLAALVTHLSDAEIQMIDRIIKRLKRCGAWSLLDFLNFLVTGTDADSRINVRQPGTYNLIKVNSPLFIPGVGWNSNGSSGYLDTGFNPASAAGRFAQNSSCLGIGISTIAQANPVIGNTGTGNSFLTPQSGSNTFTARLNSLGSSNAANTSIGLFAISRLVASTILMFKNGGLFLASAVPSTTMASSNIGILSDNSGGRYSSGMTATFAFAGAGLSGMQMQEIYRAYQEYCAFYGIATS